MSRALAHIKEAVAGILALALFVWVVLGMPGTHYPGLLPGHDLVSKSSYECPYDYNDQGVMGPPPDYNIYYSGTCFEEHYSDGMIVFRMGPGTYAPGDEISQAMEPALAPRFPQPPDGQ